MIKFVSSLVDSYYSDAAAFTADTELQAWAVEAVPANITDFPTSFTQDTLIDTLVHVAFLGSVEHQVLNTFDMSKIFGALPLSPLALYQPIPTTKNITDIMPYIPGIAQAVGQIVVGGIFQRPLLERSSFSLSQMFNDTAMLAAMNEEITSAAAAFTSEMLTQSDVVSGRTFDSDGLSEGCPFLWTGLDPQEAPYFLTV